MLPRRSGRGRGQDILSWLQVRSIFVRYDFITVVFSEFSNPSLIVGNPGNCLKLLRAHLLADALQEVVENPLLRRCHAGTGIGLARANFNAEATAFANSGGTALPTILAT